MSDWSSDVCSSDLPELVAALFGGRGPALDHIPGLTWKSAGGTTPNPDRCIAATDNGYLLPYEKLGDPRRYLARTYLGNRTVAHQVATGCRFHGTFCRSEGRRVGKKGVGTVRVRG